MEKEKKPNLKEIPRSIDKYGRCYIPKLFAKAAGKEIEVVLKPDGILLRTATEDSAIKIYNDNTSRICIPRDVLRVFGDPNMAASEYVEGRADLLFLRPGRRKCCKCGATRFLINLYNKEVYACVDCLNKAFDTNIPEE